jgi:hypothetical protein
LSSAISTPTYQAKAQNIYNADGTTPIFNSSTGLWTLKNVAGTTTFTVDTSGLLTVTIVNTQALQMPQITALTASNQNVAGKYRVQYGSTATPLTLNGLAGGVLGQTVIIDNSAAGTITINSLNAGGTQQFLCPANATLTMPTFTMATFLYDGTYWRCISTTKGVS